MRTGLEPWTLVAHVEDHSPSTTSLGHLAGWLARRGHDVTTVGWTAGPRQVVTTSGRHLDVGAVRRRLLPLRLERLGLRRVGGGLRGRAVRSTLEAVPPSGVVYLSTGFAGAVLRYLPPGERTVITHVHPADVVGSDHLSDIARDRLMGATDQWLAADPDVASWMVRTWGLEPAVIEVVPACVAVHGEIGSLAPPDPPHRPLVLGLSGTADWSLGTDHSARLALAIRRRRPTLDLQLRWIGLHQDPREIRGLVHDLDHLGLGAAFQATIAPGDPRVVLDDVGVLAVTTADERCPWAAWEAAARAVPLVCFDTHRMAEWGSTAGRERMAYPDVEVMADVVLTLHDDPRSRQREGARVQARVRAERDIEVVAPLIAATGSRE